MIKKNGFTLIEILIAVVLIGLAVVSLVASSMSFTQANGFGTNLSTAEFLVQQVRELTAMADYSDLFSYDGVSFNPPKGANNEVLVDFSEFTQYVTVDNVDDSDFESVVGDHCSNFVRVTVDVRLNSRVLSSSSWVRARE
ncbi:MAG: prepilin-type N-terminal cleavage/methylation domain-containing protein [Planctomycetota bacterium]